MQTGAMGWQQYDTMAITTSKKRAPGKAPFDAGNGWQKA
jgi:hypothetical protein